MPNTLNAPKQATATILTRTLRKRFVREMDDESRAVIAYAKAAIARIRAETEKGRSYRAADIAHNVRKYRRCESMTAEILRLAVVFHETEHDCEMYGKRLRRERFEKLMCSDPAWQPAL